MNNEPRETNLVGTCKCKVLLKDGDEQIVNTYITIPAVYTPDWQMDGYTWHDEGSYDWDYNDAYATFPDEYQICGLDDTIEGYPDNEIVQVLEIIEDNTEDEDL